MRLASPLPEKVRLEPQDLIACLRESFASVEVKANDRLYSGMEKLEERMLGPKLAAEARRLRRETILITVADSYGQPSLEIEVCPNGPPYRIHVHAEWLEWPGYTEVDYEGAEKLVRRLGLVLGYSVSEEIKSA